MSGWDSFGDDAQANSGRTGSRCHVGQLLSTLDDEGRAAVVRAIGNRNLSASGISKALGERVGEVAPKAHSISAHRRGECRCPKENS